MSREMKQSGIQWIGEIPNDWGIYRIKYNTFLKGRIGWQGLNSSDFIDEGYCLITGTDFDNRGGIHWDTCYRISKERFEEDELLHVKEGDLLMTKDGTVGKMALIDHLPEEASLNSHLLIIRQTTNIISNQFLYWAMLSEVFKGFCNIYQSGSIMSSISQSTLGFFSCPCPNTSEQQKISEYLNKVCREVDELIALQEQMIEELKAYKQSIITEAVTKGLNPNVPMKNSGIDWIGEIPAHWKPVTPKALFSLRKEKAKEGERQLTASQQYGVVYQDDYMNLTGSRIVTVLKDFDILKHVEAGDFVISMRSFQGGLEYSMKTGSISSAYVMLIPNLKYVYPRFYRWLFKSECYINALQSTSNMVRDGQAMRYSNFAQVPLYIIPIDEQHAIADYLDTKCAEIDCLIEIKQAKIEELKEYKKSVIYEYVTGKKEVI